MIRINRYYSGTDGNMDADPKWYVSDWSDFEKQTNSRYKDITLTIYTKDNAPFILHIENEQSRIENFPYRTFLSKNNLTFFWINADTEDEILQFLIDGNIKYV